MVGLRCELAAADSLPRAAGPGQPANPRRTGVVAAPSVSVFWERGPLGRWRWVPAAQRAALPEHRHTLGLFSFSPVRPVRSRLPPSTPPVKPPGGGGIEQPNLTKREPCHDVHEQATGPTGCGVAGRPGD